MILMEEMKFRDADVERSNRIGESPWRRPHLFVKCDSCAKEWWAIKQSYIKSKGYFLNNITKKDYCPSCRHKQDVIEGIRRIQKRKHNSKETVGTSLKSKKYIQREHSGGYLISWTDDCNHPRLKRNKRSLNLGGRVYSHILAMESHIGRYLTKDEKVHHIDGNKKNNAIENLYLCKNTSHHASIHDKMEKFVNFLIKKDLAYFDKEKEEYHLRDILETKLQE